MTFADLLTPEGMVIAAAMIVTLVQVVKAAIPMLDARVSGGLMAFIASALLYIGAAIVLPKETVDVLLQTFAAWLVVASSAMGIKAGADHVNALRAT
jgi:hypothetical protein